MAMHEPGKSDRPVVPVKSVKMDYWEFHQQCIERMKGRDLAKENAEEATPPQAVVTPQTERTQCRQDPGVTGAEGLSQALQRIRQAACRDKRQKFTSLWHHVYDIDRLSEACFELNRQASAGIDGVSWKQYVGQGFEQRLEDLRQRLVRGSYRATPVRRTYVPKADGKKRPIGVPVMEDKIVQRATTAVLNAIYEAEFLGFSYGFRPGRSAHMALDALAVGIRSRKVNWVLDADIRSFFDTLDHRWLVKFIEHRIGDPRVLRQLRKWLNAGVLEAGQWHEQEEGVQQGGSISPLLANIYLHYVFDLWADQWRKKHAAGEVILVRYADDFVVGFELESDARQFLTDLTERLGRFTLELAADKTRIVRFGAEALKQHDRGGDKPGTFNFLGFTHICDKTRKGVFVVLRQTIAKRMRAKLKLLKEELRRRMHQPIHETGRWLRSVLTGHYRYFGVPRNSRAMNRFRMVLYRLWRRTLARRSQRAHTTRTWYDALVARWLPLPHICHPYPEQRLAVIIRGKSPVR
jgi:RNA-directed DNA polymerase